VLAGHTRLTQGLMLRRQAGGWEMFCGSSRFSTGSGLHMRQAVGGKGLGICGDELEASVSFEIILIYAHDPSTAP